jgi:predicted lipoprotein with Yx(FWY)xxD motif
VKRTFVAFLTMAMLASTAVALAKTQHGTTIKLGKTSLGNVLTKNSGFTVYVFTRDKQKNKDTCVKVKGCTSIWPPVTTKAKPVAGKGVKTSLLGSIKLPNGSRQVTYNGHPLYGYIGDSAARQTDYVGIRQAGGIWYAINAAGKVVK